MIERIVSSFNPRLGWWKAEVWRYPDPAPKGGIPPELHPAIQEDVFFVNTPPVDGKIRKHGEMSAAIAGYLLVHGRGTVVEIASVLSFGKTAMVFNALKCNPYKFVVVDTIKMGKAKAAVWGLV